MEDENKNSIWYFAYGSNMNRAVFLDRRRMHPLATRSAWLENYRLCFNLPIGPGERAVANLEACPGAHIFGVLYLLAPEEFDRLDFTEGVQKGIYRRIAVEVIDERGERAAASTYHSTRTAEGRKPSARYQGLLLEGARQHGLPAEYVRFLEGLELALDERRES